MAAPPDKPTDEPTLFAETSAAATSDAFQPSLSQGLLGMGLLLGASGLSGSLPKLIASASRGGPADALSSVALDLFVVLYSAYKLKLSFDKVDYDALPGRELRNSWAAEAATFALSDQVPTRSSDGFEVATFAGGCFWGTELNFQRVSGVVATCVGYTQGSVKEPKYDAVCSGSTGHAEGIQMIYDPKVVSYERLLETLISTLNPTLINRVGNDRGTQYRHGIYPHTTEQAAIAEQYLKRLQQKYDRPVVTELRDATVFWPAEEYHQQYLERKGQSAEKECDQKVRCYG